MGLSAGTFGTGNHRGKPIGEKIETGEGCAAQPASRADEPPHEHQAREGQPRPSRGYFQSGELWPRLTTDRRACHAREPMRRTRRSQRVPLLRVAARRVVDPRLHRLHQHVRRDAVVHEQMHVRLFRVASGDSGRDTLRLDTRSPRMTWAQEPARVRSSRAPARSCRAFAASSRRHCARGNCRAPPRPRSRKSFSAASYSLRACFGFFDSIRSALSSRVSPLFSASAAAASGDVFGASDACGLLRIARSPVPAEPANISATTAPANLRDMPLSLLGVMLL